MLLIMLYIVCLELLNSFVIFFPVNYPCNNGKDIIILSKR